MTVVVLSDLRDSCGQSLAALSASRSFLLSRVSLFQNASVVSQDLSQYSGCSAQLKVVRAGASRGVLRSPIGHSWQERTIVSLCGDDASSVDATTSASASWTCGRHSASLAVMKMRVVRALHMHLPWTEAHLKQPVRRHLLKRGCICTQPSSLPCSRGGPYGCAPSLCAGKRRVTHVFLFGGRALFAVGRFSVPYRPLLASSARLLFASGVASPLCSEGTAPFAVSATGAAIASRRSGDGRSLRFSSLVQHGISLLFQISGASERRGSFQKQPWRQRHLIRLQVPRALLAPGAPSGISVSSTTDEIFPVVPDLG